ARLRFANLGVEEFRAHRTAGYHSEAAGVGDCRHQLALGNPAHCATQNGDFAAKELGAAVHQFFQACMTDARVDCARLCNQPLAAHAASSCASRPKAVCSTRTASSVYSSAISTETLISEVEMVRMLIPRSARVSNILAAI